VQSVPEYIDFIHLFLRLKHRTLKIEWRVREQIHLPPKIMYRFHIANFPLPIFLIRMQTVENTVNLY
jgi:hypothetical protein